MLYWQLPIYLQAQAVMAEIESMKASNSQFDPEQDMRIPYDNQAFIDKADELRQLAQDIRP